MLISTERVVANFNELNKAEVSDLAQTLVLVLKILRKEFKNEQVMQIAIQDGPEAGRTMDVSI